MERKRATLKDVAQLAGVSFPLVSKYVNQDPRGRMSAETRQRIADAIQRLGYRPSSAARALRGGRTGMLGLVVSNFTNPYFAHFADAALQEASRHGCQLLISLCRHGKEEEMHALEELLSRQVDAILCYENLSDILKENPPAGLRRDMLLLMDQQSEEYATASIDLAASVAEAVRFLGERGAGRVTLALSASDTWHRLAETGCHRHQVQFTRHLIPSPRKEAEEALHRLCEAAPPAVLLNGMRNATTFLSLIHREFPGYRPAVVTHCNFCTELLENPLLEGVIYSDTAELVRRSVAAAVELARSGRTENVVIPSQFVPQSEFHRIHLPEGRIGLTGSE